jgi:hypothetical protein
MSLWSLLFLAEMACQIVVRTICQHEARQLEKIS